MKNKAKDYEQGARQLYDYLHTFHLGRERGIKKPNLAAMVGITERELRKLTKMINESSTFEKLVSTTHSCYMCETKEECEQSVRNTYRVAMALFKKAKAMERKVGLNGQIKLHVGDDYLDIVETFTKE